MTVTSLKLEAFSQVISALLYLMTFHSCGRWCLDERCFLLGVVACLAQPCVACASLRRERYQKRKLHAQYFIGQ